MTENRRLLKWVSMRGSDDFASLEPSRRGTLTASRKAQLARRVHKGVPDAIRGVVWQALSGARSWAVPDYHGLRARATVEPPTEELDPAVVDQIELDLNRTFPSHVLWLPPRPTVLDGGDTPIGGPGGSVRTDSAVDEPFEVVEADTADLAREMAAELAAEEEEEEEWDSVSDLRAPSDLSCTSSSAVSSFSGIEARMESLAVDLAASAEAPSPGVELLRTLLRMYALHDPEVCYCQSMNFVAATLLIYTTPVVAFRIFAHLLGPLGFRRMYLPGLPLLMECFEELQLQMDQKLPRLARHLQRHNVHPSLFATQWFMTFGSDQFPFAMALRLLDLVFYERSLEPLFRLSLALLQKRQRALVAIRDPCALMSALRQLPSDVGDLDGLFAKLVGQRIKLSRELLRGAGGKAG